jgi:hypothetical protein
VHLHANAKLTPALRRLLVHRVRELGWRVTEAAEAAGAMVASRNRTAQSRGPPGPRDRLAIGSRQLTVSSYTEAQRLGSGISALYPRVTG